MTLSLSLRFKIKVSGLPVLILKVGAEGRCQQHLPMNYSNPKKLVSKIFFAVTTNFMKKSGLKIMKTAHENYYVDIVKLVNQVIFAMTYIVMIPE